MSGRIRPFCHKMKIDMLKDNQFPKRVALFGPIFPEQRAKIIPQKTWIPIVCCFCCI